MAVRLEQLDHTSCEDSVRGVSIVSLLTNDAVEIADTAGVDGGCESSQHSVASATSTAGASGPSFLQI